MVHPKSSPEGVEGSLLNFGQNRDNVVAARKYPLLTVLNFFSQIFIISHMRLKLKAWAFWTLRTCLNPYRIVQILEKSFFSKTANPTFYPPPARWIMGIFWPPCSGDGLAHSLWHFCQCGGVCSKSWGSKGKDIQGLDRTIVQGLSWEVYWLSKIFWWVMVVGDLESD